MNASLVLDTVYFRYGRGPAVLDGLSHTFAPGAVTWLRGANGSGKTTLLRLAAGLLRPALGSVTCSDRPTFVPASVAFHEQLTLGEELLYLGSVAQLPDGALDKQLAAWRIQDLPSETVMEDLSTGWRQRLALCLACAADRPVVLLDEPFANLDDDGVLVLQGWIRHATARGGIVVVAHHGSRAELEDVATQTLAL